MIKEENIDFDKVDILNQRLIHLCDMTERELKMNFSEVHIALARTMNLDDEEVKALGKN